MPKIQRKSLINLTAFRQRNGILQKALADYLGVSRGYISMVESGKSTLAKESIEKIYNNPFHWDVNDLVPAFSRLNLAIDYLNITRNERRAAEGLPPAFFLTGGGDDEIEVRKRIKPRYNGFINVESIRQKQPEYLVDMWCSGAPELNRDWLLMGKGEMLIEENQDSPSPIEVLQNKIDKLEAELLDCKALIEQMSVSLPEKVVAALQAMSNK